VAKNSLVKMTVNLSNDVFQTLKILAEKRHTTVTHILRRAIAIEKYIDQAQDEECKILIEDKKGHLRQLVFP
jgi:predicted transcriptional regulator